MKVVNFTEFCNLPDGTIFSYWKPCHADGLYRRGDVLRIDGVTDFYEASLIASPDENGDGPIMEACETRWGEFNYDQLFAVYELADIAVIAELLGFVPCKFSDKNFVETLPEDLANTEHTMQFEWNGD